MHPLLVLVAAVWLAGCGASREPTVGWTTNLPPSTNPVSWSDIPAGRILVTLARVTSPMSSEQHQILVDARKPAWTAAIDTRQVLTIDGKQQRAGGLLANLLLDVADERSCSVRHEIDYTRIRWTEYSNGKTGEERAVVVQPSFDRTSFQGTTNAPWGRWTCMGGIVSSPEPGHADHAVENGEARNEIWFLRVDHGPLRP